MHRLESLLEMSVIDNLAEGANNIRLEREIHGQVRFIPVTDDTHAFEVVALVIYLFCRIFPAVLPKLAGGHLVTGLSNLFLNVQLNWEPMAVPTGDVRRIEARERF